MHKCTLIGIRQPAFVGLFYLSAIRKFTYLIKEIIMENQKDKREENVFVGFMFLGMGIGYFMDNFVVGMFIGMGLGFLAKVFFPESE